MKIQLHKSIVVDEEIQDLSQYLNISIPNKLGQAFERASNHLLGQLYKINFRFVVYSLLSSQEESKKKELMASTQLLIQSDVLQYLSKFHESVPSKAHLGDKKVEVGKSDKFFSGSQSIPICLFYWSFICQSSQIKEILLSYDYLPFWPGKSWYSDYIRAEYVFLKLIIQDKWEEAKVFYNTNLYPAYEELAPVDQVDPEFYLPLWEALLKDDEKLFNQSLLNCIEEFKEYWGFPTDDDPYKNNDILGHFALEITALVKMAKLRGYNIKVNSDYTPEFFTSKNFKLDINTKLDWYYTPKKIEFKSPIDLEALLRENQKENKNKK